MDGVKVALSSRGRTARKVGRNEESLYICRVKFDSATFNLMGVLGANAWGVVVICKNCIRTEHKARMP